MTGGIQHPLMMVTLPSESKPLNLRFGPSLSAFLFQVVALQSCRNTALADLVISAVVDK